MAAAHRGERSRRQPASPHHRRRDLAAADRPRARVRVATCRRALDARRRRLAVHGRRRASTPAASCSSPTSYIVSGNPTLDNPTRDRWFDTSKFACRTRSRRAPTRGSSTGSNGPSVFLTDMTLTKSFNLPNRYRLEARLEAYNAFNAIVWDNPDLNISSANFGKVTRKRVDGTGREIQIRPAVRLLDVRQVRQVRQVEAAQCTGAPGSVRQVRRCVARHARRTVLHCARSALARRPARPLGASRAGAIGRHDDRGQGRAASHDRRHLTSSRACGTAPTPRHAASCRPCRRRRGPACATRSSSGRWRRSRLRGRSDRAKTACI